MRAHYYEVAEPRNVSNRIIAEEYLEDSPGCATLSDYKFLCFHGEPKLFWTDTDRYGIHTRAIYDMEGNRLPCALGRPFAAKIERKPKNLSLMIELARILSNPFPHIRVDFYESNNRVFVGEMTFHNNGGYPKFRPKYWDNKLGGY